MTPDRDPCRGVMPPAAISRLIRKRRAMTNVGLALILVFRLRSNEEAMELLKTAIHKAGYRAGAGNDR